MRTLPHHIPLFRRLNAHEADLAAEVMTVVEVGAEELLIQEGELDRSILIVDEGLVEVSRGDVALARVERGGFVGELSLLGLTERRSADVRSLTPVRCWILDEAGLERLRAAQHPLVGAIERLTLADLCQRIRQSALKVTKAGQTQALRAIPGGASHWASALLRWFGGGAPALKHPLAIAFGEAHVRSQGTALEALFEPIEVPAGKWVLAEGDPGHDAYLVLSGQLQLFRKGQQGGIVPVDYLDAGQWLGVISVLDREARPVSAVANDTCWLGRIKGDALRALLAEDTPLAGILRQSLLSGLAAHLHTINSRLVHLMSGAAPATTERLAAK